LRLVGDAGLNNTDSLALSVSEAMEFFPYSFSGPPAKRTKLVLRYVGSEPILDAGCGTGWLMAFLIGRGFDVVGLDLSYGSLLRSKKLFSKTGTEGEIMLSSLQHIPFPASHFGTVVLFDVLEHVEEISYVLSEIRRVTVKGGHILITLPNVTGSYSLINDVLIERILTRVLPFKESIRYEPLKHHHRHLHHFSWWVELLEKHGFSVIKQHNVEFLTPLITPILGRKRSASLSFYDVQNADIIPKCIASEWFMFCIKR